MRTIKGFVCRDDFIDNSPMTVATVFELSDYCITYAKDKKVYTYSQDTTHSLIAFNIEGTTNLSQEDVDRILKIVSEFNGMLTNFSITSKQEILQIFISNYNIANPGAVITGLNYNIIINYNNIKTVDSISFTINNELEVFLWYSDSYFKNFYPHYTIDIVLPTANFGLALNNPATLIEAIDSFNIVEFHRRIEEKKNGTICTHTSILNIPCKIPGSSVIKNCYFAFNIYGQQGNYDFILRLELYGYLTEVLGLSSTAVEELFPSILNINEFFVIPMWSKIAIPAYVGESAINSQIQKTYEEEFTTDKFINLASITPSYLKSNTYSMPIDYNNLLLNVVNGYYSEPEFKDFVVYYPDIITVFSTHPDFARMSTRTQRFMTILENGLVIANASNSVEMLNSVISNTNYNFRIITRGGIQYLSLFYDKHQYYILPKYEHRRLA